MNDDKNKRKLYDALSQDYDMGTYEQFSTDVEDEGKRRKLYEAIKGEYDLPDFDGFTHQLIGQPQQQVVAQEERGNGFVDPRERGVVRAPFANAESERQYERQRASVKEQPRVSAEDRDSSATTSTTISTTPTVEANGAEQQTGAMGPKKFAERMERQQRLRSTIPSAEELDRRFSERMENMRKGNEPFGSTSGLRLNPETGKMESVYYTRDGQAVSTPIEQRQVNKEVQERWETTTEEGMQQRYGKTFDDVTERAWQNAEERTKQETEKVQDKAWSSYAAMGGGREMRMMTTGEAYIGSGAARMKEHDMKKMSDEAWELLGAERREAMIQDYMKLIVAQYGKGGESGSGESMSDEEAQRVLREEAERLARATSDQHMYEKAIEKNMPRNVAEFVFSKVAGNSVAKLMQAASRVQAGTRGDMDAQDVAMVQYGKDHKVADIVGSVGNIALDPVNMLIGAGAGAATTKIAGSVLKKMPEIGRMAQQTTWGVAKGVKATKGQRAGAMLVGKVEQKALGGGINFAMFEGTHEAIEQLRQGGVVNSETGEVDGYSLGRILGSTGRGLLLGVGTGAGGAMLGNAFGRWTEMTKSTVGKVGIRALEVPVSIAVEGGIFAIPDYMSGEGEWDMWYEPWLESAELMVGFKAQHAPKSALRVYEGLKKKPESRAGFETRLRTMLDRQPDFALTEDERKELEENGYMDLAKLVEGYKESEERAEEAIEVEGEVPYNRFEELIQDKDISEEARAKMHTM